MSVRMTVTLGLADCLDYGWLATCIQRHKNLYPDIAFRLRECSWAALQKGLGDGEFDVGFCQSDVAPGGYVATLVRTDPLALALSSRHPLLAYSAISAAEIQRYPMITLARPISCQTQIERLLRPDGFTVVHSMDLLMAMVAAGYGVGLAPIACIRDYRCTGTIARKSADWTVMLNTYLVWPHSDSGSLVESRLRMSCETSLASQS